MTAAHLAALHFDGKGQATKKRFQILKTAGLISDRRRRVFGPAVLFLAPKAFKLLKSEGILHDYPEFDLPALAKRSRVSEMTTGTSWR